MMDMQKKCSHLAGESGRNNDAAGGLISNPYDTLKPRSSQDDIVDAIYDMASTIEGAFVFASWQDALHVRDSLGLDIQVGLNTPFVQVQLKGNLANIRVGRAGEPIASYTITQPFRITWDGVQ